MITYKKLFLILLLAISSTSFSQSKKYILALSKGEKKVIVYDYKTLDAIAKIPVGDDPHEVVTSPDGSFAYISLPLMNDKGHEIAVLNLKTLQPEKIIDTKPFFIPHGLVYLNDQLWFTAQGSKVVGVFDIKQNAVTAVFGTGENFTHLLYVTPDGKRFYTTNVESGTLGVYEYLEIPPYMPPTGVLPANSKNRQDSSIFSSLPQLKVNKCAVIIGVNKTGCLPVLAAAVKGAEDFQKWADSQNIKNVLITDKKDPVTVQMIKDAINNFVDQKIYDQLIVYYSGHGILKSASDEQWLLSNAPKDINEAVNVQPSKLLSRRCGIPNVVIISDACRSLPKDPRLSEMFGSVIFPNVVQNDTMVNVDILYATSPGNPAYEVAEDKAVKNYKGIYTQELLEGLNGKVPQVMSNYNSGYNSTPSLSGNFEVKDRYVIVPAYELSQYLFKAVPRISESYDVEVSQKPDAEITSRPPSYLSIFKLPAEPTKEEILAEMYKNFDPSDCASIKGINIPLEKTESVETEEPVRNSEIHHENDIKPILNALHKSSIDIITGFTIIGISYVKNLYKEGVQIFEEKKTVQIRINRHLPYNTFFLDLPDERICPLAVLPGFIGTVIFDKGEVLTVNYTPSFPGVLDRPLPNPELEARRAMIAAKSKNGTFKISKNIDELVESASYLRRYKSLDPSLGLYAAYAYSQAGKFQDVQSIFEHMQRKPEPVLFDVLMLKELTSKISRRYELDDIAPFCPMLNQGWSYMTINPERYDPFLLELSKYRVPGLWTTFNAQGAKLIRETNKDIYI